MRWEQAGDEVWLSVEPGEAVRLEDVVREADAAGYQNLDVDAVVAALTGGPPARVARLDTVTAPGRVWVTISEDGMAATLHVSPPGERAPAFSPDDAEAALEAAGVRLGVDRLLLGSLPLDRPGEYLVATGWEPAPGGDGHVEYALTATHEVRPRARGDGGVDFHAVATIPDVRAGQLLAILVDPGPGTPGRTVRGEPLTATPGEPATLPRGANVTVSDDGRRLYAAIDGLLEIHAGQVSVRPDLLIPGDVDFETGSIAFRGDVIVRGSVRPGFRVQAGGRVVVMGDVEQAEIEARDLVWVRGSVLGERALIRCAGTVKARTIREARIEARGSVFVEREVQDATVLAGTSLLLEGSRTRLAGGSVWAGREIVAGELGSVAEVATRVVVGRDPFTAEEIEKLEAERAEHTRTHERVATAVAPFRERPEQVEALDPRRGAAVRKLFAAEASLRARLAEVEERLAELAPAEDQSRPRIVVRHALRPGVILQVKQARLRTRLSDFRVAAVESGGAIVLTPVGSEPRPQAPVPPLRLVG